MRSKPGHSARNVRRRILAHATVLLSGLLALGCTTSETPFLDLAEHNQSLSRTSRLGVGDRLKITVFAEPTLSGTYDIDAGGSISFPLIGKVRAKGLPINTFRNQLRRKLADGYLKNPKLTVDIASYRPIFVHGEVRSGGQFPYKVGLRLKDAVAVAGGFTYRANEQYIMLTRDGRTGPVRVSFADNITLLPGDNVRILERFF